MQDYCRLRAGDGADALFADPAFVAALDKACWEAYPRALAMVGTVAEAALRPYAGDNAHAVLFGLIADDPREFRPAAGAAGDRRRRTGARRAPISSARSAISRERSRETAEAVARDHSSFYLAIMPLHPKLGADDFPALRSQLKLSLLQIQEAFAQRANLMALAGELAARVPKVESSEAPSLRPPSLRRSSSEPSPRIRL